MVCVHLSMATAGGYRACHAPLTGTAAKKELDKHARRTLRRTWEFCCDPMLLGKLCNRGRRSNKRPYCCARHMVLVQLEGVHAETNAASQTRQGRMADNSGLYFLAGMARGRTRLYNTKSAPHRLDHEQRTRKARHTKHSCSFPSKKPPSSTAPPLSSPSLSTSPTSGSEMMMRRAVRPRRHARPAAPTPLPATSSSRSACRRLKCRMPASPTAPQPLKSRRLSWRRRAGRSGNRPQPQSTTSRRPHRQHR